MGHRTAPRPRPVGGRLREGVRAASGRKWRLGHQPHSVRVRRGPACHRRGLPSPGPALIVDEAWGAHLPFHPDLPSWAMDAGADVCVTSIHKMGSGLEQGSVFHLQGDLSTRRSPDARRPARHHEPVCACCTPASTAGDGRWPARTGTASTGPSSWREMCGRRSRRSTGCTYTTAQDFCGPGMAEELDPLPVDHRHQWTNDDGYRVADWLRTHRQHRHAHRRPPPDQRPAHPRRRPSPPPAACWRRCATCPGRPTPRPGARRRAPRTGRTAPGPGVPAPGRLFRRHRGRSRGEGSGTRRRGDDDPLPAGHPHRPPRRTAHRAPAPVSAVGYRGRE